MVRHLTVKCSSIICSTFVTQEPRYTEKEGKLKSVLRLQFRHKHQATTLIQQIFTKHLCARHYSKHLGYTTNKTSALVKLAF